MSSEDSESAHDDDSASSAGNAPWYVRFFKGDYLRVYGHTLRQERTELETRFAMQALDIAPHHRVLDLCCGQGRHSIALAKTGLDVTGVDLSDEMLTIARNSATEAGDELKLNFRKADMRDLPTDLSDSFDAVVNMFSSFGYLESEAEDAAVLGQVSKVLKPGGKLLMDLLNREWVIINNEEFDWTEHEGGRIVLERRQLDLRQSVNRLTYTEICPDGTRNRLSELNMRLYTLTELTKVLDAVGLRLQATYGTFNGDPYTVNTRRLILIAQKT